MRALVAAPNACTYPFVSARSARKAEGALCYYYLIDQLPYVMPTTLSSKLGPKIARNRSRNAQNREAHLQNINLPSTEIECEALDSSALATTPALEKRDGHLT